MPVTIQPTSHTINPNVAPKAAENTTNTTGSVSGTPVVRTALSGDMAHAPGALTALHEAFTKLDQPYEPRSALQSRAQVAFDAARTPAPTTLVDKYPTAFSGTFKKLQENPSALRAMIPQPANIEMARNIAQMTGGTNRAEETPFSAMHHLGDYVHETGKEMGTHMLLEEAAHAARRAAGRAMRNVIKAL